MSRPIEFVFNEKSGEMEMRPVVEKVAPVPEAPAASLPVRSDEVGPRTRAILQLCLETAVPLWAAKMQSWPAWRVVERAHDLGIEIASTGDVLMFQEKGRTARAFNHYAEAIACLSFVSGGVTFLEMHFQHTHPEVGARER